MYDILFLDAELGKTLQELNALVCRKHHIESIGGGYTVTDANLHFRGAPIEDLCLDFTLPGYPDYILKSGDEIVRIHSLLFVLFVHILFLSSKLFFCQNFRLTSVI